jgi:hypothetical protein
MLKLRNLDLFKEVGSSKVIFLGLYVNVVGPKVIMLTQGKTNENIKHTFSIA